MTAVVCDSFAGTSSVQTAVCRGDVCTTSTAVASSSTSGSRYCINLCRVTYMVYIAARVMAVSILFITLCDKMPLARTSILSAL
jgi:hypothetical protein